MEKIYDLIIVGAGPAGITASVYAARKQMVFVVLTGNIGGQTIWTGDIENYTGYQFITGPELASKFEEHIEQYKIPVKETEEVTELCKKGAFVVANTTKGTYKAKTAVIASGKKSRELGVPGEKELKNKGLTYCATCDGPLFSGKDVVIVGGGNSALDAVLQLEKIAGKIYIVNITSHLGGDAIMREKVIGSDKVEIMNNSQVTVVHGDTFVSGVSVKSEDKEKKLPVQGIFVEIGLVPNSDFVKGVEKNEQGEIKVNCHNETNIPGIFAAGDVTDVPEKQIIIAAGEGSKACLGAFRYISRISTKDWG
ncbi:MAG: NAD(P)/FAD-dependent oxidoreductase [Candidatus Omnitrophota bacterium]